MTIWGVALLVGLTGLAMTVMVAWVVVGALSLRDRKRPYGDPEDLGAPLSREVVAVEDELFARKREMERRREPVLSRDS